MKKTISLILSVFTLCAMTGCSFFPTSGGVSSSDTSSVTSESSSSSSEDTNKLVYNGKSDYKMVLEDEASYDEEMAAWELEELFAEATSITLESVYEEDVTYSDDAKLIILGDTKFTEEADVDVSEIPHDGFVIKTVGSNIFILGENAGVTYGAYEFLSQTLGFEYFIDGIYTLDKNVKNLDLPELDISDAPDFEVRADGWAKGNTRTRTEDIHDPFIKPIGEPIHNTFSWLPKADYESSHPSWYSVRGDQLCYTARGNASELAVMRATVLEKFKQRVQVYFNEGSFDVNVISFTQQDNTYWCTCSGCKSVINAAGGAGSATVIQFLNPIARDLQAWVDVEYPGREVGVAFFAYHETNQAPTNLEMADNVYVWTCLPTADTLRTMDHSENTWHKQNLETWASLSKKLFLWRFDSNWNNYLLWWDTFGALQDFYQCAKSLGAVYVFNEGLKGDTEYTGFDTFKAALNYKLMWDVDTDVEAFTQRFFDAYFLDASEPMKAYYDSFREWSAGLIANGYAKGTYGGTSLFDANNASHWPQNKLAEWSGYIQEAYESIVSLEETDSDCYTSLCKRINMESIAIRYAQIQYHNGSLAMKQAFKEDALALDFKRKSQLVNLNMLWDSWGV